MQTPPRATPEKLPLSGHAVGRGVSVDEDPTRDVAHSLCAEGFDATGDGRECGTPIVPMQQSTFDLRYFPVIVLAFIMARIMSDIIDSMSDILIVKFIEKREGVSAMNRTEAASQAIKELVEASGLAVGDRLPAETSLARDLGFGRSTIREVLRQWESLGIVTRRKSAGTTIVSEISTRTLHIPLSLQIEAGSILRMLEVRRPLELEAVRLCCGRASDDAIRRIRARGAELISVYEAGEDWRPADHRYHREIHLGADNDLFAQMIEQIQYFYTGPADAPLGAQLGKSTIPQHADLTEAITVRDVERAVKVMSEIMTEVETEARELIREREDA